ncbi:MAG: hypothetical protein AAF203_04795, partial [Pseudomonadota bacterium]
MDSSNYAQVSLLRVFLTTLSFFLVALILPMDLQAEETSSRWSAWVQRKETSYSKRFAAPTMTHHVYLKKKGDVVFVNREGSYPRLTKASCGKCPWKIIRVGVTEVSIEPLQPLGKK